MTAGNAATLSLFRVAVSKAFPRSWTRIRPASFCCRTHWFSGRVGQLQNIIQPAVFLAAESKGPADFPDPLCQPPAQY